MKDIFSIKGKVIVITGGGNGIGQNLSVNMAHEGAYVYSIDIKFQKTKKNKFLIEENCDITDFKKFEKLCNKIFKKHKKIDV